MSASSIRELLCDAASRLREVTASPELEARLLMEEVLNKPESWLLAWPEKQPELAESAAFTAFVEERLSGKPIAHILARRAFWTLELDVTPDTLIPRPDTEILVETALELFAHDSRIAAADLGTGTGAIALALASERPEWRLLATDLSTAALEVARINAAANRLDHVRFEHGHWFDALPDAARYDLLISNPPYIRSDDPHLEQGDVRFEPIIALTSGADGLDAIRHLVANAAEHLKPAGVLMLEHGYDQGEAVRKLFCDAGFHGVETRHDYGGNERVTFGRHFA